jgi:uncharacterized protein (TIGR03083 family)
MANTDPRPVLDALRRSHERLQALVGSLSSAQLEDPSYDTEWTIAQVLSHLGSQSEIFRLFVDATLKGEPRPAREQFEGIWQTWDAKSPGEQVADGLRSDLDLIESLETLASEQPDFEMYLHGREMDLAGVVRSRLAEHALHTWDVAVALDDRATVSADAVSLLIDTLGPLVSRVGKPNERIVRLQVTTTEPAREFVLEVADEVSLRAGTDDSAPQLDLPAEAFIRLVYGRLDPDHTPPVETRGLDLGDLRTVFPGV